MVTSKGSRDREAVGRTPREGDQVWDPWEQVPRLNWATNQEKAPRGQLIAA